MHKGEIVFPPRPLFLLADVYGGNPIFFHLRLSYIYIHEIASNMMKANLAPEYLAEAEAPANLNFSSLLHKQIK